MGQLINGEWLTDVHLVAFEKQQYKNAVDHFKRGKATFRHWITKNG